MNVSGINVTIDTPSGQVSAQRGWPAVSIPEQQVRDILTNGIMAIEAQLVNLAEQWQWAQRTD